MCTRKTRREGVGCAHTKAWLVLWHEEKHSRGGQQLRLYCTRAGIPQKNVGNACRGVRSRFQRSIFPEREGFQYRMREAFFGKSWQRERAFRKYTTCHSSTPALLSKKTERCTTIAPVREVNALDPFGAAVPFWGQTTQILSSLSPTRDCGPKRVEGIYIYIYISIYPTADNLSENRGNSA